MHSLRDDLAAVKQEVSDLRWQSWGPWLKYQLGSTGQAVGLGAALVGLFVLCSPPHMIATPVALLAIYYGMRLYHFAQGLAGSHRATVDANRVTLAEKRGWIKATESVLRGDYHDIPEVKR